MAATRALFRTVLRPVCAPLTAPGPLAARALGTAGGGVWLARARAHLAARDLGALGAQPRVAERAMEALTEARHEQCPRRSPVACGPWGSTAPLRRLAHLKARPAPARAGAPGEPPRSPGASRRPVRLVRTPPLRRSQPAALLRLLRAGADMTLRDAEGKTALQWAKEKGHAECVCAFEAAAREAKRAEIEAKVERAVAERAAAERAAAERAAEEAAAAREAAEAEAARAAAAKPAAAAEESEIVPDCRDCLVARDARRHRVGLARPLRVRWPA